jgi:hypothetical protein
LPLLVLVLLAGGTVTGVGVPVVIAVLAQRFGPGSGPGRWWVATGLVGGALVLDRLGVRAPAVGRQVPQPWGHRHGPWAAALRYAPRLGFGPATIVPSWLWWAGLGVGTVGGVTSALAFGISYVCIRCGTTVGIGAGIPDGVAMAQRMRRVAAARPAADRLAVGAGLIATAVLTAQALR